MNTFRLTDGVNICTLNTFLYTSPLYLWTHMPTSKTVQHGQNNLHRAFVGVVEAALSADYTQVRRISNHVAKMFADSGENDLALHLRSLLKKKSAPLKASGFSESLPLDPKSRNPLIEEMDWPEFPLFLSTEQREFFFGFIQDVQNVDKLARFGLAVQPRLLLSGPPGTGKTLMAAHIAAQLERPLYVARFDALISSFLGETAKNIRYLFDYIAGNNAVLLIDEIDAVAKMRNDKQELGELKRVVNTLIQGLDMLDEYSIIIGATNHENLLDMAIWRRFPYKIYLTLPGVDVRKALWKYYLFQDKDDCYHKILASISNGMSCADIMELSLAERRRAILQSDDIDMARITMSILSFDKRHNRSYIATHSPNSQDKKDAAIKMSHMGVSKSSIASLLGTSRTTIYSYLKGDDRVR